jgi:KDO2-lipid IV(A) lauroyltransferase
MSLKYAGYKLAQLLSNLLPSSLSFRFAERLADLQFRHCAKYRLAVRSNLAMVLGAPVLESSPMIREVFRNFGRYLVELFSFQRVAQADVVVEGREHLTSAYQRQHGALIVTAHMGNWEIGAAMIKRMGFSIAAVALPHEDWRMDRLFNTQRCRFGVDVIPLGRRAARQSLQCLKEGRFLGILGDRAFSEEGLPLTLWGHRIRVPRGPAILSMRSHAPIIPSFFLREGMWRFRLCFEPPIWPASQQASSSSVESLTQAYAAVIERYVKRFPTQWLMFQPIGAPP